MLADGVSYACKDLGADIILDMATLTGAQVGHLGSGDGGGLVRSPIHHDLAQEAGELVPGAQRGGGGRVRGLGPSARTA